MKQNKNSQSGFGLVAVLLVIVALTIVFGVGVYANYRDHSSKLSSSTAGTTPSVSSTQANSTHPASNPDPYAGWNSYTSKSGQFTLRYPTTWQISGFQGETPATPMDGQETEIVLVNPEGGTNTFGMDLDLTNSPSDTTDDYSKGTATSLSNGLSIWIHNQGDPNVNGRGATCPDMQLVSGQSFITKLSNGTLLTLDGSFCWSQKSNPTYTYSQQVGSISFAQAERIIESIEPSN